MNAFDDLGGRRESASEALARWNETYQGKPPTEQELAAQEVERREKMRQHDAHFATDFLTVGEQQLVSRSLAKKLGVFFNDGEGVPE